jgi:hypothetical protein
MPTLPRNQDLETSSHTLVFSSNANNNYVTPRPSPTFSTSLALPSHNFPLLSFRLETMFVHLSVITVYILACLSLVQAAALPRRSGLPSCHAVCPPTDIFDSTLGVSDTTTDPIFCSYPAVPGQDPNRFFCKYFQVNREAILSESH